MEMAERKKYIYKVKGCSGCILRTTLTLKKNKEEEILINF